MKEYLDCLIFFPLGEGIKSLFNRGIKSGGPVRGNIFYSPSCFSVLPDIRGKDKKKGGKEEDERAS